MDSSQTKQLLQQYYKINTDDIPQQREKSKWKPENNFGFLLGIIAYGTDNHRTELHRLLLNNQFKDQGQSFIDSKFDCYIRPFHKSHNNDSESCHSTVSSRRPSRSNSAEDLDFLLDEKKVDHKDLKKAVAKRDVVCLFCWNKLECEGAHIIAQKNIQMPYDQVSLLQRAGLTHRHQVQNGLLLCQICHSQFDKLKRFVDFIDDKFVVKVVNETNDTTSDKHREWLDANHRIKFVREGELRLQSNLACKDGRQAVYNGEMALYFIQDNQTILPNRSALEFHKTACLIWRMAGGAEPDEEYCSDDDLVPPVDTAALKRRFRVQDSNETLGLGNL